MSTTSVSLPKAVYDFISTWAEKAYPHEGCGLLVGRFSKDQKDVVRFVPLVNRLLGNEILDASTLPADRQGRGAGKTEFYMDPAEFNSVTLAVEKEGLDVVGVLHTHPDHPPRPSKIDAAQPFLAQWSNIIVSVQKGRTQEMKSWFRDTDQDPFVEEPIRVV